MRGGPDEVVARARVGDQDAWAELYARHAGRLVAWLRLRPGGDPASAPEDIAAQAWLTAAAKIHDFAGSEDQFAGWLFGIARKHAANDRRRVARRRTSATDTDLEDTGRLAPVVDPIADVDSADAIRGLLAELSPREAEVLACIDVIGLDVRATAAALDMTATAVRVAHHRGLKRLRHLLSDRTPAITPEGGAWREA